MGKQSFRRILVVGTSGSGKTTLSKNLSESLQLPRLELDAFRWNPGWSMSSDEEMIQRVREFVNTHEEWVIDGNYSMVREILWPKADLVIWLNYPILTNLYRLLKRTLGNLIYRKTLCNGNYESIRLQLSKQSIFLWVLQTYWKRKKTYKRIMKENQYPNLTFKEIRTSKELQDFLHPSDEENPGFPSKR